MTRIRCRDRQCTFNKNGLCTSEEIEYEPDAGCLTMEPREEVDKKARNDWEKDEEEDWDAEADWSEDDEDWEEEEDDEDDDDDQDLSLHDEEEERLAARRKKPGRR